MVFSPYEIRNFVSAIRGNDGPQTTALDKVSFDVKQGEVFGLAGPNGAGKTTLIKILCTLVLPNSGRALVNGVDVVRNSRKALTMLQAVLAENSGFERRLTARQNLEFYADLYGIPRNNANARIDELLEFCHLTDKADVTFQTFSTGMSRRLLICRALLRDASVLLFDEPTSGLDPLSASEFRRLIKGVLAKENGKTVLISTHNLWEAEQICDRIAILQRGRITAIGKPSEIRQLNNDSIGMSIVLIPLSKIDPSLIDQGIRKIDGVKRVKIDYGNETIIVAIEGARGMDFNRIFEFLSAPRFKILSLESTQPTLEDAFIKLVSERTEPWNYQ